MSSPDREYFEAQAQRGNVLGDVTYLRLAGNGWLQEYPGGIYGSFVETDFVARTIAATARERAALLHPGDKLVVAFHVQRSADFTPWEGDFDAWFSELQRVAVSDFGFVPRAAQALTPDTWRAMYFDQRVTPARALSIDLAEG